MGVKKNHFQDFSKKVTNGLGCHIPTRGVEWNCGKWKLMTSNFGIVSGFECSEPNPPHPSYALYIEV